MFFFFFFFLSLPKKNKTKQNNNGNNNELRDDLVNRLPASLVNEKCRLPAAELTT